MQKPRISIIAAIGKNRELGKQNELIWRIPDDLKRVKALTMGHPLIMGRKTYESIGRPLPGRTSIVVSRTSGPIEGCIVVDSLQRAIEEASIIDQEEVFIFGGAQIYTEALPYTDRLYLTLIDAIDPDADTFFPDYGEFTEVTQKEARGHDGLAYEWLTRERITQD